MSTYATILLAWAAIYGYLCAYHALLFARRRSDREYLAFGLLAGGFAVVTASTAFLHDAETLSRGLFAMRVGNVGLIVSAAFYVDLIAELTGRRSRLQLLVYAWAVLGLVGEVLGLFYVAEPATGWLRWGSPAAAQPAATLLGLAHLGGLGLLTGLATLLLFFPSKNAGADSPLSTIDRSQARLLGVAAAANVVAASHDVLARGGVVRGPMLLEHTAVGFAFAMSYVLLHRFARASTELERKKAELDRMYEELRQTQEKLVRKEQLAAVGELSAVIAHEVRNPLAVIKNAVSGLRRGNLAPDDRATLLDILDEETARLNRLMHDLLAYARPVVPKGRELSVDELVRRAVERAASGVPHADAVEVVYDLAGPPTVHGDPELLRHALVNVVENALQAMPAGGTLTVRSSDATLEERVPDVDPLPAVALSFADTGEGMDTLVRAKARDPFFTTRSTGTGLGLAIVERVVRNHGGEVDIESLHGVGTTITFVLPRRRPAAGVVPVSEGGRRRRLSGIREAP